MSELANEVYSYFKKLAPQKPGRPPTTFKGSLFQGGLEPEHRVGARYVPVTEFLAIYSDLEVTEAESPTGKRVIFKLDENQYHVFELKRKLV